MFTVTAVQVFDLAGDPWELTNLAGVTQRGDAVLNATLPLGVALSHCSGPVECNAPKPTAVPKPALPCVSVQLGLDVYDP